MEALAGREEVLASERRWSLPVALMTLAAIGFLVASAIVVGAVNGDGEAEILRAAHEHSSAVTLSSILQAAAFVLLAAPLVYLFRAARARSPKVRAQLIGLVIAAPLFLVVAAPLNAIATNEAASDFVAGKATTDLTAKAASGDCRSERKEDSKAFREEFGGARRARGALARCSQTKVADDEATNAVSDAPARAAATGFGLAGRLGLAFALVYSCLWGMRTGLLTRFWGSLGIALGAAALLLLIQFTLIWFLYFALLVAGWVPGGRPPAWAAGEAIPWPSPGEQAAARLEREENESGDGPAELPEAEPEPGSDASEGRRKRKQRD